MLSQLAGHLFLWKKFLQNCDVHSEQSSELLLGGVVVEVHVTGGFDLLLCAEFCYFPDRVFLVYKRGHCGIKFIICEEYGVFHSGCYLAECLRVACE